MEIIIDQERLKAPSIELSRTILHECFHAYIYGKIHQEEIHNGLGPEPNFSKDWKQYKLQYGDTAQHFYMANKYMKHMKEGLEDYFFLNENSSEREIFMNHVSGNDYWKGVDSFIEQLCWGGLKETDAWENYIQKDNNYFLYNFTMSDFVTKWPKENCN